MEEDSTAAVAEDFMEVAEQGFTGVEVSTPEATLDIAADTPTADIVAATTEDAATTEVAAVMAGGVGLRPGRKILGPGIRLRMGLGIWLRLAVLGLGISVWLLLQPRYYAPDPYYSYPYYPHPDPNNGDDDPRPADPNARPEPNRKVPSNPGDPRHRETQPTRTTQTATSRPLHRVGRLSPLTG